MMDRAELDDVAERYERTLHLAEGTTQVNYQDGTVAVKGERLLELLATVTKYEARNRRHDIETTCGRMMDLESERR